VSALLLRLTGKPGACDQDPTTNSILHAAARRDAATGMPITREGAALLATARPWPDAGPDVHIGECICGSSLLFTLAPAAVARRCATSPAPSEATP
jgi:hypothetical protein